MSATTLRPHTLGPAVPKTAGAGKSSRPMEQPPEPGRCWVRYTPRPWPGPDHPWVHLGRAGLGPSPGKRQRPQSSAFPSIPEALDDVLYLPPVSPLGRVHRDELAHRLARQGTPVLLQVVPPEAPPAPLEDGVTVVLDVLHAVLQRDLGVLTGLLAAAPIHPESMVVWPLVSGISDDPGLWAAALDILHAAGARRFVPLALQLTPAERRRLADGLEDDAYHALFHKPPPPERDFARFVHRRYGLRPFWSRPLPRAPQRFLGNRALAGHLARAGDLCQRLDYPEGRAQAYYQAARWVDGEEHDVAAIAREGNLGVVEPLGSESRALLEELVQEGYSRLLDDLEEQYLADPEAAPASAETEREGDRG